MENIGMNQIKEIAFHGIFNRLNEQLDRFDKNNSDLSQIGNKFIDDSSDLVKGIDENKKSGHNGLIKDMNLLLDRLNDLNTAYARQIDKLQSII